MSHPAPSYKHPHLDLRAALANAAAYIHGYPDGDLHADTYEYTDAQNYTYIDGDTATVTDTINVPTVSITDTEGRA